MTCEESIQKLVRDLGNIQMHPKSIFNGMSYANTNTLHH